MVNFLGTWGVLDRYRESSAAPSLDRGERSRIVRLAEHGPEPEPINGEWRQCVDD
jgi:hypothetical protein